MTDRVKGWTVRIQVTDAGGSVEHEASESIDLPDLTCDLKNTDRLFVEYLVSDVVRQVRQYLIHRSVAL